MGSPVTFTAQGILPILQSVQPNQGNQGQVITTTLTGTFCRSPGVTAGRVIVTGVTMNSARTQITATFTYPNSFTGTQQVTVFCNSVTSNTLPITVN